MLIILGDSSEYAVMAEVGSEIFQTQVAVQRTEACVRARKQNAILNSCVQTFAFLQFRWWEWGGVFLDSANVELVDFKFAFIGQSTCDSFRLGLKQVHQFKVDSERRVAVLCPIY